MKKYDRGKSFRIDKDLLKTVHKAAKEQRRSIKAVIELALEEYFKAPRE